MPLVVVRCLVCGASRVWSFFVVVGYCLVLIVGWCLCVVGCHCLLLLLGVYMSLSLVVAWWCVLWFVVSWRSSLRVACGVLFCRRCLVLHVCPCCRLLVGLRCRCLLFGLCGVDI